MTPRRERPGRRLTQEEPTVPKAAPAPFRTRFLSARFTEADAVRHEQAAAAAGITVSDMIRAALDGTPPPRRTARPVQDRAELAQLLAAVGKIGSNVNQLAYVANTGGWPHDTAIAAAVSDIQWMRHHLMLALGVTPTGPAPPGPAP